MTDVTDNNGSPEVRQVLQSKRLLMHIRHRLHTLNLKTCLSEKDVMDYVVLRLNQIRQSGLQVNDPVNWARLVSTRYINIQYKNRMSEASEPSKVECLSDRNNQEMRLH